MSLLIAGGALFAQNDKGTYWIAQTLWVFAIARLIESIPRIKQSKIADAFLTYALPLILLYGTIRTYLDQGETTFFYALTAATVIGLLIILLRALDKQQGETHPQN